MPADVAPTTERVGAFLELTRLGNAVAASVLTFTGSFVAGGLAVRPVAVVAAVVATAAATGAGNAINDYFDRDIDRINRPERPIPSGAVSPRETLVFSLVLFGVAVVAAVSLPSLALGIAVVNLLALVAYTELFKGLPGVGNVVVAYLTGSTFLFGAAAVGDVLGAAVLAALAALATFTREVVKDVEDVAGDREEGLRTLPIVIGSRPALWVGVATMVVAVAASVVPFLGEFGIAYLVAVVPADVALLYATRQSFSDPAGAQRLLKRGMFVAAAAFVVGRAAVVYGV